MKLTKEQKKTASKDFGETLKVSANIYFTAYQGLKFQELAELRAQLRKQGGSYRVIKNSLLMHALKQAGISGGDAKLFEGPNGVVVGKGDDPVSPAKVLVKFAKDFPNLKLKGAYVGAQWMGAAECQRLAALGSRTEILGSLANTLYSTLTQSAGVLAAPIRDFVLVLRAVEEQKRKTAGAAA